MISVPPSSLPGTSTHKQKLLKKKVAKHTKPKKHHKPAAKPKAHVVSHSVKKVVKVSTAHTALAQTPTHVVDLALEGVHVNLRRSSSGKKA